MKTGQYYFEKLSEVEQKEFKENVLALSMSGNYFEFLMEDFEGDLPSFLKGSFTWEKSSQGFDYWQNIAIRKID